MAEPGGPGTYPTLNLRILRVTDQVPNFESPVSDWSNEWGAPVFMRFEPGSEPLEKCDYLPCIRRGENQGPFLTPEEEKRRFEQQVKSSKGFDINFEEFRCVFNYVPVDFDENYYFKDTDTTRGVIERLSQESLAQYNKRRGKCFEFVEVIKANTHPTGTAADMFYITFRAKEPSDDQPKDFQAMVCYFCYTSNKYHSFHSIESAEKEDAKKPRLTEELSAA
ncbi:hypothetical protein Bca4012_061063 [Brassica carinata]